jgi:L-fucose isomerase-like protein
MNLTLGVILGNRGFFPDHLCDTGRAQILATLEQLGFGAVILPVDASKYGSVESNEDAGKCAELFWSQSGKIDGVLVTLPNFGDERGVANA